MDTTGVEGRWGDELVRTHDRLRADLNALRAEVSAYAALAAGGARPVPSLGLQLRVNCLAFCEAVHLHHTHEDGEGFPFLRDRAPHLAPVLDRLGREHVVVARILDELRACLADVAAIDPARLRRETYRLTADLEAHLAYEEAQLVDTLNAADPTFTADTDQPAR